MEVEAREKEQWRKKKEHDEMKRRILEEVKQCYVCGEKTHIARTGTGMKI